MSYRLLFCFCLIPGFILLWNQSVNAQTRALRDPTQPAIAEFVETDNTKQKEKKEEDYLLQSIIIAPTRRVALINDKYVNVGDHVGEDKVEAIRTNSVVLSRPGQKRTIYLFDLGMWRQ
ncbi:MAG: hypothetical protein Q8R24_02905 [Legionellaceae bacterium]|nr:hypothetical protein [Legionellaceae bacterium]